MRQVADQTDGRMRLGPGTLDRPSAPLLGHLGTIQLNSEPTRREIIEEVDLREDMKLGHERRRYHRLPRLDENWHTPIGRSYPR